MLPFRGSDAVARGLVTAGALRGRRFVRLFPDIYVSTEVEIDLAVRSRAAYLLFAHCGGVLAGYSAAAVLGADCAPPGAAAEVLVAGHVRRHPGLAVRRGTVPDFADRRTAGGCRVTSPLRTAWDLGRRPDLVEAVVAVDALAGLGRFAPSALLDRRASAPGARGCRRLDRVVDLADPRAESPMETRLRLVLVLAGLPRPESQFRVDVDGREVRFDLAYPAAMLAVEYDGGRHDDDLDRRRDVRTGRLGWYTARFTARDIAAPETTAESVRVLLDRRLRMAGRTERDLSVRTS